MILIKGLGEFLLKFFFKEGSNQGFITRFGFSLFGSFLFHLTLIVVSAGKTGWTNPLFYNSAFQIFVLLLVFLLSVIFGLTISVGYKTGLIQGFLWGVFLPWICYFMALLLINFSSTTL